MSTPGNPLPAMPPPAIASSRTVGGDAGVPAAAQRWQLRLLGAFELRDAQGRPVAVSRRARSLVMRAISASPAVLVTSPRLLPRTDFRWLPACSTGLWISCPAPCSIHNRPGMPQCSGRLAPRPGNSKPSRSASLSSASSPLKATPSTLRSQRLRFRKLLTSFQRLPCDSNSSSTVGAAAESPQGCRSSTLEDL